MASAEAHQNFDYIIVGGGSGGCVLANRLSADPAIQVCLVEAGGDDDQMLVNVPLGMAAMLPTKINNYAYETTPQPGLNASYDFSDDIMGYLNYRRGYRRGSVNGLAYQGTQQVYYVEPEQINAYEGGLKTRLFDRRVQLNLAGFYCDYKNYQVRCPYTWNIGDCCRTECRDRSKRLQPVNACNVSELDG